jgi:hypothetical protein
MMTRVRSSVCACVLLFLVGIAPNAGATPVVINEFVADHAGADTQEFLEIFGTPNTNYSTLRILQIEGDGTTQRGVIDSVITPGVTNAEGFWTTPFLSGEFENGTLTFLLVQEFSGFLTQDLDSNDDGILNVIPWASILDGIGVRNGGATDLNYGGVPVLTIGFDGIFFPVGGASRIPNGLDTDSVRDWVRNDFDGNPVIGEAFNTPNATNAVVPEPSSVLLMWTGLAGLILTRARKSPRR